MGQMIAGVETRPENLPGASANYSGLFNVTIGLGAGGDVGPSNFNVDFAAGTFTGTLDGTTIDATIAGVVVDNGLSGTASFTGAFFGDTSFDGKFYGPTANDLAGVLSGTVMPIGGGASESLYGYVRN